MISTATPRWRRPRKAEKYRDIEAQFIRTAQHAAAGLATWQARPTTSVSLSGETCVAPDSPWNRRRSASARIRAVVAGVHNVDETMQQIQRVGSNEREELDGEA